MQNVVLDYLFKKQNILSDFFFYNMCDLRKKKLI